jgi:hypothetical protein
MRDGPTLETGGVVCVERVGPVGGDTARFEEGLLLYVSKGQRRRAVGCGAVPGRRCQGSRRKRWGSRRRQFDMREPKLMRV